MDILDDAYLVNLVHNDFKDPDAIFVPFFKVGEKYAAPHPQPNHVANGFVN